MPSHTLLRSRGTCRTRHTRCVPKRSSVHLHWFSTGRVISATSDAGRSPAHADRLPQFATTWESNTLVFVHGVCVGGSLWTGIAERLDGLRCVVPTWPLGAHADPAPEADLSANAIARRVPGFLEALDLSDATLVGNDTGGGLCLAALGSGAPGLARIGRIVLTNCDSYEHFAPKGFDRIAAVDALRAFDQPDELAAAIRSFIC